MACPTLRIAAALVIAVVSPRSARADPPHDDAGRRLVIAGAATYGAGVAASLTVTLASMLGGLDHRCFRACGEGSMIRPAMLPIPVQVAGLGMLATGLAQRGRQQDLSRRRWRANLISGAVYMTLGYALGIVTHWGVARRCRGDGCPGLLTVADFPGYALGTTGLLLLAHSIGAARGDRDRGRASPQLALGPRGIQVGVALRF